MNITVSRYVGSKNWAACIRPDDGAWFMFVDVDNKPTVYLPEPDKDEAPVDVAPPGVTW